MSQFNRNTASIYTLCSQHFFDSHIAVDERILLERIKSEKKKVVSAFYRETAENVILDTIDDNEQVNQWIREDWNEELLILFSRPFKKAIGYGYIKGSVHRWCDGPVALHKALIVLAKKERSEYGFVVLTAYPIL